MPRVAHIVPSAIVSNFVYIIVAMVVGIGYEYMVYGRVAVYIGQND